MKTVPLSRGKMALVDDEDYGRVIGTSWYALKGRRTFYAAHTIPGGGTLLMHRLLLPGTIQVDHRDGDGLNNQRANLRAATNRQNHANLRKTTLPTASKYKGVVWDKRCDKWMAQLHTGGKNFFLGRFVSEESAAQAYNDAAREHFGEFAQLNGVPL